MPRKNLPTRSKIITAIVGFLVTLYLLIVGFSYLKSWNDFKPYHKLAVELNAGLGGGYTIYEHKQCDITLDCPYVELSRSTKEPTGIAYTEGVRKYFQTSNFTEITPPICSERIEDQCTITGVKNGLKVVASTINGSLIEITVHKK